MSTLEEPPMDAMRAIDIIESEDDETTPETVTEAWQYLIDTGLCWSLQGWYGRVARSLIEDGVCTPTPSSTA
jgi:hypothetical protein